MYHFFSAESHKFYHGKGFQIWIIIALLLVLLTRHYKQFCRCCLSSFDSYFFVVLFYIFFVSQLHNWNQWCVSRQMFSVFLLKNCILKTVLFFWLGNNLSSVWYSNLPNLFCIQIAWCQLKGGFQKKLVNMCVLVFTKHLHDPYVHT